MSFLKQIQSELLSNSNEEAKAAALKFVPDAKKVYGVRTPVLNDLAKKYKDGGFELVEELWKSGAYEEKMIAAKLLGRICKKDADRSLRLVEKFSTGINDWAICDAIGMQSLKPIAHLKQKELFSLSDKLSRSKNFWQRRLSLVLVEVFTKDPSFYPAIRKKIKQLENDEEYYVRKAVEWIRRNLQKSR